MPDTPTIFITGGRGRLGRALTTYLVEKGYDIRVYSRNEQNNAKSISALPADLEKKKGGVLIHLAWSVVPAEAEKNPQIQWDEDLPLLQKILHGLFKGKKTSSPAARFVFFSSGSVYGESRDSETAFQEGDRTNPKGLYAAAKVEAEQMILKSVSQGLRAAILRISNPYGFSMGKERPQGVIPALCRTAENRGTFSMWGNGSAEKDYLYIEDLCRAVELIIKRQIEGTYNIASGEYVSLEKLILMIEELTGNSIRVESRPAPVWDVQHGRFASQRIQKATGWQPVVPLRQGLIKFWSDFRRTLVLQK